MLFKMFTFADYLVNGQRCMSIIKVSSNWPVISAERFILYSILNLLSRVSDDVFNLSCILIIYIICGSSATVFFQCDH